MPRNWQSLVAQMSDVQRLVHLAARMDSFDADSIRTDLLRQARQTYEQELTIQARLMGCSGRRGRLGNGPILSEINSQCKEWADSIVNTYNYDLAIAIIHIGNDTPAANRFVYAKRLRDWEASRAAWKDPQISLYTETWSITKAQQDFAVNNGIIGIAVLQPQTAVCPICQGWITRGSVPLRVALNDPPPYHPNCPHYWDIHADKVAPEDCQLLWMGE